MRLKDIEIKLSDVDSDIIEPLYKLIYKYAKGYTVITKPITQKGAMKK